jgi:pyrroloquinoline quinone biosynthesis protein A
MQETLLKEVTSKKWVTPAYCDVRLGFEVTAYVYVR